jgi:hypothetical protein
MFARHESSARAIRVCRIFWSLCSMVILQVLYLMPDGALSDDHFERIDRLIIYPIIETTKNI